MNVIIFVGGGFFAIMLLYAGMRIEQSRVPQKQIIVIKDREGEADEILRNMRRKSHVHF